MVVIFWRGKSISALFERNINISRGQNNGYLKNLVYFCILQIWENMIQRVQSIYLLLIAICQSLLFFTALATFTSYENSFNLSLFGFYKLSSSGNEMLINNYALMVVNVLMILFSIYIIFGFKNRKKQIKLTAFNFLLICAFIVLMFYSYDNAKNLLDSTFNDKPSDTSTTFGIGMILPLLSMVFNFLAMRGIKKDEEMVNSADRIR